VALPARLPLRTPPVEQTAGPPKTSGLAIASLICSIGNFVIIPFGFIPGIICGHLALKQLAREPGLRGRGLAKAGLILGYIGLVLLIVLVVVVLVLGLSLTKLKHA
jgi:hypothetical protein